MDEEDDVDDDAASQCMQIDPNRLCKQRQLQRVFARRLPYMMSNQKEGKGGQKNSQKLRTISIDFWHKDEGGEGQ